MGFSGYFLIVWDFINWAKEHGIPVGPGRGSGAGSIVAWSLRITDLDPIPYNLLFERFLNPERVSMPDFDIDFCMNRRGEVIKYVTEKYGKNHVGQIVTMHQLKARGVIRDIARVMSIPYAEADKVAKLVPEPVQGKAPTIDEALEAEPQAARALRRREGPVHASSSTTPARSRGSTATPACTPPASSSPKSRCGSTCRARAAPKAKSSPSSPRTRSSRRAW